MKITPEFIREGNLLFQRNVFEVINTLDVLMNDCLLSTVNPRHYPLSAMAISEKVGTAIAQLNATKRMAELNYTDLEKFLAQNND